jgi:hypothetical protein
VMAENDVIDRWVLGLNRRPGAQKGLLAAALAPALFCSPFTPGSAI